MTETIDRPVRVTIEGNAHEYSDNTLRVFHADSSILINRNTPGVTVENVEPERVWTDGDVVQIDTGRVLHTYTRDTDLNGTNYPWSGHADSMSDAGMTDYVSGSFAPDGWTVRVLRHQAGE